MLVKSMLNFVPHITKISTKSIVFKSSFAFDLLVILGAILSPSLT
jgi:hypothetical protein